MGSISLAPMLMWLGMGLAAVVCARVVWRAVSRPRGLVREASCARCRYPVEGLETWECPECGSDLRVVGVITPELELRRRGSAAMACMAWTALAIALGITAWTGASRWARQEAARAIAAAPVVTRAVESRIFVPRRSSGRLMRRSIAVEAERTEGEAGGADGGEGAGDGGVEVTIVSSAMSPSSRQRITISPDGWFRWLDGSGAEVAAGSPLTRETLAEFLEATGSEAETAGAEAEELLAAVEEMRRPRTGVIVSGGGRALAQVGVSMNRSSKQMPVDTSFYEAVPRWVAWGMVGVWGLGMAVIPARKRGMIRRAGRGRSGDEASERPEDSP